MARVEENIETLRERLPAPCLGVLPFAQSPEPRLLAAFLDFAAFLDLVAAAAIPSRRHSRESGNPS